MYPDRSEQVRARSQTSETFQKLPKSSKLSEKILSNRIAIVRNSVTFGWIPWKLYFVFLSIRSIWYPFRFDGDSVQASWWTAMVNSPGSISSIITDGLCVRRRNGASKKISRPCLVSSDHASPSRKSTYREILCTCIFRSKHFRPIIYRPIIYPPMIYRPMSYRPIIYRPFFLEQPTFLIV